MRTPSAAYAVRCLHYSHAQSALLRSVVDVLLQLSLCGPSFGVYQFGTRFLGVVTSADVQLRALSVSIDAASTKMNGCQRCVTALGSLFLSTHFRLFKLNAIESPTTRYQRALYHCARLNRELVLVVSSYCV